MANEAETPRATRLLRLGYTDLISVIPPGSALTPESKIDPAAIGKIPGVRAGSGLWHGYDWRKAPAPGLDTLRRWEQWGANVGLRTDRFPAVDIDCTDAALALELKRLALHMLGPAPVRVGRPPKQLLLYRTAEPFGRMRLWMAKDGVNHLVEVLGAGQQFVALGTHPATGEPYRWTTPPGPAAALQQLTRSKADTFLLQAGQFARGMGYTVEREGSGETRGAAPADQEALLAPSLAALQAVMESLPNRNEDFPTRQSYLKVGYAVRAAAGPQYEGEAAELFGAWAARWDGNGRAAANAPETVRADWSRMRGPYAVGYPYLVELSQALGGTDGAEYAFEAVAPPPQRPDDAQGAAPLHSDQWLADRVVQQAGSRLRYVKTLGCFLVWSGSRWQKDESLLAEHVVMRELRLVANALPVGGAAQEQKATQQLKLSICSGARATTIANMIRADRALALSLEALDADPWLLNTPGGVVDLRTGVVQPSRPDLLCSRQTSVRAADTADCPRWLRFLDETTNGDAALSSYLQRLVGYCLTGLTREQQLTFVHGGGRNGKSVFLNAITGMMGDYAATANTDAFTANVGDRHSTEIAMLAGARLVSAAETELGKRWNEARVKQLTGGDRVTARFMRQDNFTFLPQFKLLIVGNHKPEIRGADEAMRRRVHLVPFTTRPKVEDPELGETLRGEYPGILRWAIEGCLLWQQQGLNPPETVRAASEEYFEEEDAIGRWLEECCTREESASSASSALYECWRTWTAVNGEYTGSLKRFTAALAGHGFPRWEDRATRRRGFRGLTLRPAAEWQDTLGAVHV